MESKERIGRDDLKSVRFPGPGNMTGIRFKLIGEEKNSVRIVALARRALRQGGFDAYVELFTKEATSGDFQHLVNVCFQYFQVY